MISLGVRVKNYLLKEELILSLCHVNLQVRVAIEWDKARGAL